MFAGKNRAYRLVEFIKIVTGWRPNKQRDIPSEKGSLANNYSLSEDHHYKVSEVFFVIETDQAELLVGDLFRRRFNTDSFPEQPCHFVAFAKLADGSLLTLGYVHFTIMEEGAIGGGLVIDERHYRKLPPPIRHTIKRAGGVAEILLRESFKLLPDDLIAIWGYVGNKQAEKVDLRVGFEHTDAAHIMVIWKSTELSASERQFWLDRVVALGPF